MPQPLQLSPHLWALPSRSMHYNAGVLASAGQAWLIDPGPHPDEVAAAAGLAASLGTPVGIALTHSHWDHILGPERLPDLPAFAHERFAATLAQRQSDTLAMIDRWERRFGYARATPFRPPQLHATAHDGQTLALGDLELRLLHIPGHAADQLAIFEPAAGALWAADTLSDLEIPFVSHSLAAYEATLERLAALPIKALVPGHGAPTADPAAITGRLAADRAYLDDLRRRVTLAIGAGASVTEAVAACATMTMRSPAENAGPHRLNVESAYIELGGQADARQVGWAQEGLIDE
ncbi:MAG: MBL fold metallo-hydrolase [Chloroflexales bacterium]|nr:MBL fold metallo-hydrolase [Chloroflexales bacterium]